MDLSWASLEASHATLRRWRKQMSSWGDGLVPLEDEQVKSAILNDLDTPRAMQRLRSVEKSLEITPEDKRGIFLYADQVLGLDLNRQEALEALSPEIEGLLAQRALARASKDWQGSDRLRDLLEELGIIVSDTSQGQSWSRNS